MDFKWFTYGAAILMAVVFIVCLWLAYQHGKRGNKFLVFIHLLIAVALAFGFYGLFWKQLFG